MPCTAINSYRARFESASHQKHNLSEDDLDQATANAYQFYQQGALDKAALVCRYVIASAPDYGWCYSLYAAVLRKQGRLSEAISMIDMGLRYEPGQKKLLEMRTEIERSLLALARTVDLSPEKLRGVRSPSEAKTFSQLQVHQNP